MLESQYSLTFYQRPCKKTGHVKISMWKIASIKVYAAMALGFVNNKEWAQSRKVVELNWEEIQYPHKA